MGAGPTSHTSESCHLNILVYVLLLCFELPSFACQDLQDNEAFIVQLKSKHELFYHTSSIRFCNSYYA